MRPRRKSDIEVYGAAQEADRTLSLLGSLVKGLLFATTVGPLCGRLCSGGKEGSAQYAPHRRLWYPSINSADDGR